MRRIFCFFCALLLACPAAAAEEGTRLPVIMYHHISADPARAGDYVVTPELLEGDLRYLAERGYTAVGQEDILNYRAGLGELPEKPVLITFDDGQLSVLEYALPLLEKYDMRAVAALVGAYCDAEEGASPRSPEYSYLSWAEAAQLAASGRFDLACHTQDMHREASPRRGCLPKPGESSAAYAAALAADLDAVEAKIESASGARPLVFAYPFGFHCDETAAQLRARGYLLALTCENRVDTVSPGEGMLTLGRFNRPAGMGREQFFALLGIE